MIMTSSNNDINYKQPQQLQASSMTEKACLMRRQTAVAGSYQVRSSRHRLFMCNSTSINQHVKTARGGP